MIQYSLASRLLSKPLCCIQTQMVSPSLLISAFVEVDGFPQSSWLHQFYCFFFFFFTLCSLYTAGSPSLFISVLHSPYLPHATSISFCTVFNIYHIYPLFNQVKVSLRLKSFFWVTWNVDLKCNFWDKAKLHTYYRNHFYRNHINLLSKIVKILSFLNYVPVNVIFTCNMNVICNMWI